MNTSTKTVYVTLTGRRLGETEKAVRFRVQKLGEQDIEPTTEWFPLSQISKMYKDPLSVNNDWIMVAEWIVDQKGIKERVL